MNGRLATALSILGGVGGLLLTVILWWADQESKSLTVEVISKIAVSPELPKSAPAIVVSIDGRVVDNAHISLVELTNTGTQPIVAREFEGPILISVNGAKLIHARLAKVSPANLEPSLTTRLNSIAVSPLLLNSGDRLQVSVVTNGPPTFTASARIAGIQEIAISDDIDTRHAYRAWRDAIAALALLILYAAMFYTWVNYRTNELRRWALGVGAAIAMLSYFGLMSHYSPVEPSDSPLWMKVLFGVLICIPVLGGGLLLVKTRSPDT